MTLHFSSTNNNQSAQQQIDQTNYDQLRLITTIHNNDNDNDQKQQIINGNINDDQFNTNWHKKIESFDHMNLNENLLRGIYAYGWQKPSDIQQLAIKPVVDKHDTIAQAQSGTGKTGAFSIASLQILNYNNNNCQVLIYSPTRELARQSYNVLTSIGTYLTGLTCRILTGGTSVRNDIIALKNGIQIIVGTPGRCNHLISSGFLKLNNLSLFILDEADEMLSRGFQDQIYDTFQYIPQDVQVCLFSATMPQSVLLLTKKFLRNPIHILVRKEQITLAGIKQYYIAVEKEDYKLGTLLDLYSSLNITQAIIFVNCRRKSQWLTDKMKQLDFTISCINGGMNQSQRQLIMKEFRSGSTRILITTDLLARGIDVNTVSLVVNYDLPKEKETYIHRIGRSGRYGKKGCAINFVTDIDEQQLRDLETFYDTIIDELPADIDNII
jgi:translation initiation factor 4A